MDYSMPLCDGFESTIKIRKYLNENASSLKQPYIVCLTSYSAKAFKKRASKSGMNYFQEKPIFAKGIKKLLSKAKLIQNQWVKLNDDFFSLT